MQFATATTATTGGGGGLPAWSDAIGASMGVDPALWQLQPQPDGTNEPDPGLAFSALMADIPTLPGSARKIDPSEELAAGSTAPPSIIARNARGGETGPPGSESPVIGLAVLDSTSPQVAEAALPARDSAVPGLLRSGRADIGAVTFHDSASNQSARQPAERLAGDPQGMASGLGNDAVEGLPKPPPAWEDVDGMSYPPPRSGHEAADVRAGRPSSPDRRDSTPLSSGPGIAAEMPSPPTGPDPTSAPTGARKTASQGDVEDGTAPNMARSGSQVVDVFAKAAPAGSAGPAKPAGQSLRPSGESDAAFSGTGPGQRPNGPTEAESLWLGRLLCHRGGLDRAESSLGRDDGNPVAIGPVGILRIGQGQPAGLAAFVAGSTTVGPPSPFVEPEPSTPLETELLPLFWSAAHGSAAIGPSAIGPSAIGALATTAPPAGAVPHLAASIVAISRHGGADAVDVTLSPDELGGVRLRLEVDANDPERMIVHLAFDRPDTMDLFRRNADLLSEAIRAAGYSEARLDFGQAGAGDAGQGDRGPQARNAETGPSDPGSGDAAAVPAVETSIPLHHAGTTGLDLRI